MADSAIKTIPPLGQSGYGQNAMPAPAASPLRGHIPALDGVRGLAIVLVMLCHFIPRGADQMQFDGDMNGMAAVSAVVIENFIVVAIQIAPGENVKGAVVPS